MSISSLHPLILRLLTYAALLAAARLFMMVVGVWYCYWRQSPIPGPKSVKGFFRFAFPRQLWTSSCVRIDLSLVVLRKLTGAWGVVPVTASVIVLAPVAYGALTSALGDRAQLDPPFWMYASVIVFLLLIHDFGEYIVHYSSHRLRFLWEFHKVHHSTQFMTPLSAKRAHFVDDLARMVVIGPALGLSVGVLAYIFQMHPANSFLFGLDAYVLGNLLSFEQLRHSYIPLTYGRAEAYLMSPAQHQVHHNRYGRANNFGSFLAVWDRLFGTFSRSLPPGSFELGLNPSEQDNYNTVWKLYVRPFWNIGILAKRSWIKRRRKALAIAAAAPAAGSMAGAGAMAGASVIVSDTSAM